MVAVGTEGQTAGKEVGFKNFDQTNIVLNKEKSIYEILQQKKTSYL